MKKRVLLAMLLILGLVLLSSCQDNESTAENAPESDIEAPQETAPPSYETDDEPYIPEQNGYEEDTTTIPEPTPYTATEPAPEPTQEPAAEPTDTTSDTTTEDVPPAGSVAVNLTAMRLEYEEGPGPLEDLDFMHIVDLNDGSHETNFGDTIMIRTNVPLSNVEIISIQHNSGTYEDYYIVGGPVTTAVESFLPGEGFIIYGYVGLGTLPHLGITFLDETGQRWHFGILQNNAYPDEGGAYILIPLSSSYPYERLDFMW